MNNQTLDQWLDAEPGRAVEMARHFSVSDSAVHQWRNQGVPLGRMKAIRAFTGGRVTLEAMVPDAKPTKPELIGAPGAPTVQQEG